jgi:hypothetical protein
MHNKPKSVESDAGEQSNTTERLDQDRNRLLEFTEGKCRSSSSGAFVFGVDELEVLEEVAYGRISRSRCIFGAERAGSECLGRKGVFDGSE